MVKLLSKQDHDMIEQAIAQAEQNTRAEIVLVVVSSSDHYLDFVLLYGLLFANFLTVALWADELNTHFLELLAIQIGILLSLFFVPFLRQRTWRLVPKRILHQRSSRRALEEYHAVHRKLPATAPFVLMFISVGEHNAHIFSSHAVSDKIADDHWQGIIGTFIKTVPSGLSVACTTAIEQIGALLAEHFPPNAESYKFSNQVIEKP